MFLIFKNVVLGSVWEVAVGILEFAWAVYYAKSTIEGRRASALEFRVGISVAQAITLVLCSSIGTNIQLIVLALFCPLVNPVRIGRFLSSVEGCQQKQVKSIHKLALALILIQTLRVPTFSGTLGDHTGSKPCQSETQRMLEALPRTLYVGPSTLDWHTRTLHHGWKRGIQMSDLSRFLPAEMSPTLSKYFLNGEGQHLFIYLSNDERKNASVMGRRAKVT
ncbi:hypothetical protein SERLA73DRAFT_156881 [Serpula lacrymans var. lacrymans S7.3]|uniref:Uncharacterized protein n=1 Tax=Serpula lacrymans var. lacrymans (strain S7.3) TaxID=936435 RepID=F8QGD1_SERL3|nr:hypothetical protein SERLA73DRAFT_156881 [Serpula lacrymans var. lacrymans S7.3]